jgi:hypothetical protein
LPLASPQLYFFPSSCSMYRSLLPFWSIGLISQFLDHFTDGRTPWTGDQLVARPLPIHRTTQTQKTARTHTHTHTHQTSMTWVGFEPTIPASERAKTVHALDRSATETGPQLYIPPYFLYDIIVTFDIGTEE